MRKAKYIGAAFFICCTFFCFSQNRNSIWCFGDSAGINFSSGTPIPFVSGMDGRGSCASIADTTGQLLFYAFDRAGMPYYTSRVFNKSHLMMVNGDTIVGRAWYNELMIIPMPDSTNKYYLFSTGVTSFYGLFYSVIDMSLDNGNGALIQKNVQISSLQGVDALISINHGNGRDCWLIFKDYNTTNNTFKIFSISPSGVFLHHSQNIGGVNTSNLANLSLSSDGNKLLFTTYNGLIEVMNFDRCSGYLDSAQIVEPEIISNPLKKYFGSCFSQDGSKIYVSTNADTSYIFQYDFSNNFNKDTIYKFDSLTYAGGALRLAIDKKIYLSNAYYDGLNFNYPYEDSVFNTINMNLSVINFPDSLGVACDFQPYSFYLGGKRTYWGLPNNPNYDLGPLAGSGCDTLTQVINQQPATSNAQLMVYYHNVWQKLFVNAQNIKGKNCLLEIFDVNGKKVFSSTKKTQPPYFTQDVSLSNLSNGMYIVKLATEKEVLSKKFIVEK